MDCSGNQLLARAALPGDQHRDIRRRYFPYRSKDFLYLRTCADDVLKTRLVAVHHLIMLTLQTGQVGSSPEHNLQLIDLNRLTEKVVGSAGHGLERMFFFTPAGNDNH